MTQKTKIAAALISACAVLMVGLTFGYLYTHQKISPQVSPAKTPEPVSSPHIQALIEYAEEIVKAEKPTPPEAARVYAYTAVTYQKLLAVEKNSDHAAFAVAEMLNQLYPKYREQTAKQSPAQSLSEGEKKVLDALKAQETADPFHSAVWDKVVPTGVGKWVGTSPFAPTAGEWTRWIVDQKTDFQVPPPITPVEKTAYQAQIDATKKAASERDTTWGAIINFWGGTPGTETPSGIWLNRYRDTTKDMSISEEKRASDYALLSQSLADSFMECWKVKYTYWAERPSMADSSIVTAMKNPPFPAYVSGHSTISRTAAEILGALYPEKAALYLRDAAQARDSRLYAGIHLPQDNDQGFILGEKIGKAILAKYGLASSPVLAMISSSSSVAASSVSSTASSTTSSSSPAPVASSAQPPASIASAPALPSIPWQETSNEKYLAPSDVNPSFINVLYQAQNDQNDDSIHSIYFVQEVSATAPNTNHPLLASEIAQSNMTAGWKLTVVSKDAFWSPGGCANMPTISLGDGKYLLMDEAKRNGMGDANPILSYVLYGKDEQKFAYLPHTDESLATISKYVSTKIGVQTAVTAGFQSDLMPKQGVQGFITKNGVSAGKNTVEIRKDGVLKTALYTWGTGFRAVFAGTKQLYFGIGPVYQGQVISNISFARSSDQKRVNLFSDDVYLYCAGVFDGLWRDPEGLRQNETGDESICGPHTRNITPIALF
jgi:hypothetical protein